MNPRAFVLITFLITASIALAQNKSDELKQRIFAQAQGLSAGDYGFTRTIRTDSTTNGNLEHTVRVEKYDPTKPADARWTLVSVNNAPPPADDLKEFQKQTPKRRVPGYYRLALYFGSPAAATTDARGRTVFKFASLSKGSVIVLDSDVSQNASAEATVSESGGAPFVEQVHITVKSTRIKLIMKLDSYESSARYRLGPEGKPLLVELTSDMAGSGMGKEGRIHTVTTYSDYHAVAGKQ